SSASPAEHIHDSGSGSARSRGYDIVNGSENIGIIKAFAKTETCHREQKALRLSGAADRDKKRRADHQSENLDEKPSPGKAPGEFIGQDAANGNAAHAGDLNENRPAQPG